MDLSELLMEMRKESLTDHNIEAETDPVEQAERVALKYEAETPSILGKPVIMDRGVVLACENDLPHVKVYAWVLIHLNTGEFRHLDISKASRDCRLTVPEVRKAVTRLLTEDDLVRTQERGRDLFRLNVQYGKNGTP